MRIALYMAMVVSCLLVVGCGDDPIVEKKGESADRLHALAMSLTVFESQQGRPVKHAKELFQFMGTFLPNAGARGVAISPVSQVGERVTPPHYRLLSTTISGLEPGTPIAIEHPGLYGGDGTQVLYWMKAADHAAGDSGTEVRWVDGATAKELWGR